MDGFDIFEIAVSVAAAVILFIHGLNGFSAEIREAGGEALNRLLARLTRYAPGGFVLGAAVTVVVQSSSATSGVVVALVEAGTISFRGSLPIFLGANVGTTSTAWLVAANATILGPFLIVLSALLMIPPGRISLLGRSVFYLGVVLLALQLISNYVAPLKDSAEIAAWFQYANSPLIGLAVGIVATILVQSSSVVVGLTVIAVSQGLLMTEDVVPIVLGANIGTTSTALIASFSMGLAARRAAIVNVIFNIAGVLAFLPFMDAFGSFVIGLTGRGAPAVATVHLLFNVGVAVLGFLLMPLIIRFLDPKEPAPAPA